MLWRPLKGTGCERLQACRDGRQRAPLQKPVRPTALEPRAVPARAACPVSNTHGSPRPLDGLTQAKGDSVLTKPFSETVKQAVVLGSLFGLRGLGREDSAAKGSMTQLFLQVT